MEQFVIDDVDSILEELPASRQMLMFSATVPGWVSSLARCMMKDL